MKLLIENWRKFVNEVKDGAKPDFLDLDKDGNKTEPMKKAAKDAKKTNKNKDLEEALDDYPTPGQDEGPVSFYGIGGTFDEAMNLGMDFPKSDNRNLLDSGTSYSEMLESTKRYGSRESVLLIYDLGGKYNEGWKIGRALELGEELAETPFEDGKYLSPSAKIEWENIKSEKSIQEKKMTKPQMKKREKMVKGMKSAAKDFEKRYPGRGKDVMYATATKMAQKKKKKG